MKVVGLITEYNPFHNGHLYHIQKALELTGADRVVVVMSGNYVQRGTPALMPKELRTKAALCNGASLVLELPLAYATGTAEQFAFGAVSILHKLGCIDTLCFGSECGNIEILQEIASILHSETDEYKTLLQQFLREGASFPVARSKALDTLYPGKNYKSILDHPNNILGIEYLKSLLRLKSTINPCTIKRSASEYHDTKLNASFSSATAIRQALISGDVAVLKGHVPDNVYSLFETTYLKRYPIESNDFSLLLKHRLMLETKHSICDYADVS